MQPSLYYIQVYIESDSYWYIDSKKGNWISSQECISYVVPTAVNIFEAKQIISKDKKEEEGSVYFLIPTTSSPIQIIE